MEKPLVSILIPFKNTAEFLEECLDSILKQTYTHWEIIAVDDHSQDNSKKILLDYAERDQRIKVLVNLEKGIIPALRCAYEHSSGSMITRMDSDDIMMQHKLHTLVGLLKKNGKGHLAVGQVEYFSSRGISDGYARYERWLNTLTAKGNNYQEIYKECVIPSPCWLAHREDLDRCGAFTPDRYPEDYDLTFRFYEADLVCIPCKEVLHLWRDYHYRTSRTSEHYAQNYFLDIKLFYFLKLDWDKTRTLSIWGAGTKGKTIAKALVASNIPFCWVCDNPKKVGKKIYGKELVHYKSIQKDTNTQSIITVANEEAQGMIRAYFGSLGKQEMTDYFFFC